MLHIIKKSPYETNALNNSINYLAENDIVLLIEDAVYTVKKGGKFEDIIKGVLQNNEVYCLDADIKARGISEGEIVDNIKLIDYKGFVEKVCEHNPVTWP